MRSVAMILVLGVSSTAWGYTIQSPVTDGCHESITAEVIRTVRAKGIAFAIPPQHIDEEALIKDLPFDLPDDLRDMATVAVLFGARKPDVRQYGSVDIASLALVHGDPNRQGDHCLRAPTDDEPDGSTSAIALCQASHLESIQRAFDGLAADGSVDISNYDPIETTLPIRGKIDVSLNRFWVNVGIALHTTQDAYTHTFRDDDVDLITSVLNWVDFSTGDGKESRDGPQHRGDLDECKAIDARRKERLDKATAASVAVLEAMLTGDPASRVETTRKIFENITTGNPACNQGNHYCTTPDEHYAVTASCMQVDVSLFGMLVAGLFWRIRSRRMGKN